MCVIIHQPKGAHIDKETCRKLWQTNPDGGGFAFVNDDDELVVEKAMDFKTYWSLFEQARSANSGKEFMLHMRIATHGSVHIKNVHPFVVDGDTVMGHNGIIHGVPDYDDDRTDTEVFISEVLPQLPDGWQDNFYLSDMVEEWIGWSKLMFMSVSPHLEKNIYRLGDWDQYKGLFLSNLNGLEKKKVKATAVTTYRDWGHGSETSEHWSEWEGRLEDIESAWEADMFEDQLKAERKTMGIDHAIIEMSGDWDCYGCNMPVDLTTAECMCWDLVCGECWQFVANCKAQGDCVTATHYNYDNLEKDVKEHVQEPTWQKTNAKILSLVLPEGAGNTRNLRGVFSPF
jgi:hypothetical protein